MGAHEELQRPAQRVQQPQRALAEAGVVSGGDLTAEAALAKLLVLLSRGDDPRTVAAAMTRDLAGELTAAPPA